MKQKVEFFDKKQGKKVTFMAKVTVRSKSRKPYKKNRSQSKKKTPKAIRRRVRSYRGKIVRRPVTVVRVCTTCTRIDKRVLKQPTTSTIYCKCGGTMEVRRGYK